MAKLNSQRLNDRAYAALKKGLMSGEFKPGEVLTIRRLAGQYGISATPIREALQRLIAEGSLELMRNRSIRVPPLTVAKLLELKRIRCLLEGSAGELAMPHFTTSDIARLSQMIREMDEDIVARNVAGYLRRNEKFHSFIYSRARSPIALRIIQDLWTQAGPFFNGLFEDSGYLRQANVGHNKILASIKRGDAAGVRRDVVWDISEAAASLLSRLQQIDSEAASVEAQLVSSKGRRQLRYSTGA